MAAFATSLPHYRFKKDWVLLLFVGRAAFLPGWALGSGGAIAPATVGTGTVGFTVQPIVTIVGLHGTLDVTLNGSETVALTASGPAAFTTAVADGSPYTLTAAQRTTFALDADKRNRVSQSCTVTGGAGVVSGASITPAVSISCTHRGYVYDPNHGLSYLRCSAGQSYRSATNDCQGAGASPAWGAGNYQYCSTNDNACNDALPAGENSTLINGHVNGGAGTLGKTNWRLPRISELERLVEHTGSTGFNAIDLALFPDNVGGMYWSSSSFALSVSVAWNVLFSSGFVGNDNKTNSYPVRCVAAGP